MTNQHFARNNGALTFGSLFSGIGGLDLGLERAGLRCAWQVEIDDYPNRVLERHWPDVPRLRDVREAGQHNLSKVDLIAGGFPCQDISSAGRRAGIEGKRSGLWSEFYRIVCELRPRYVLVENVGALLHRGRDGRAAIGRVLGDLAEIGMDAQWECLPAFAFGAPHLRERIFIVAYAGCVHGGVLDRLFTREGDLGIDFQLAGLADWAGVSIDRTNKAATLETALDSLAAPALVSRLDDGLSERLGALKGFGNAVVPQVAQFVGECIQRWDGCQ